MAIGSLSEATVAIGSLSPQYLVDSGHRVIYNHAFLAGRSHSMIYSNDYFVGRSHRRSLGMSYA